MYRAVYAKFSDDPELREKLLATNDAPLIETMVRGRRDTFWGVRNNRGTNMLGQILMRVRSDLRGDLRHDPAAQFVINENRTW